MNIFQTSLRSFAVLATLACSSIAVADTPQMLILGDSVPFGYIDPPGYEAINADNFVGFPTYLERRLGYVAVNAACPGETTGSFLFDSAPDNGCRAYRAKSPLHVGYRGTQADFAQQYLNASGPLVKMVIVTLGANDVYLLQAACKNNLDCFSSGFPSVLAYIGLNLGQIVDKIRKAGYVGDIIVANYYSPDYKDKLVTDIAVQINSALQRVVGNLGDHVKIADVFTSFRNVANSGKPCVVGLLNLYNPATQSPPYSCDIHPSQSGHKLIAEAIAASLSR